MRTTIINLPGTINFDGQIRKVSWEPSMETNGFMAEIQTDYRFFDLDRADAWAMTHQPQDGRIHLGVSMSGLVTLVLRA